MPPSTELIDRLANLPAAQRSGDILGANPQLLERDVIIGIADLVNHVAREDLTRAENIANLVSWLADLAGDDFCRGRAARCTGNIKTLRGNYAQAIADFESSSAIFRRLGVDIEEARTLSSALQPLIYLGNYAEALKTAERARKIAVSLSDELLQARLDINFGNILHRQDRFSEAVKSYEAALASLTRLKQPRDCAIAFLNLAVCYISLNDASSAEVAYRNARLLAEQESMPTITAQADYNIAYLHYHRGEYAKAIALYQKTRLYCQKVADQYHSALCDLDQSELYLDLYLHEEAIQLASQALAAFEEINMPYEATKSLIWLGIGAYQNRKSFRALELFAQARERMKSEGNAAWTAVLDLYQALLMQQQGRYYEALRHCKNAQHGFAENSGAMKAVHADLLRASLHLDLGEVKEANKWLKESMGAAEKLHSPFVLSQAYRLLGRSAELQNSTHDAVNFYRRALDFLEKVPLRVNTEDLKIPYSKNKGEFYHSLLSLELQDSPETAPEAVFAIAEKSKAREIAELLSFRANMLPTTSPNRSALVEQLRGLREELNWYYRQADNVDLNSQKGSAEQAQALRRLIRNQEETLLQTLDAMRSTDEEFHSVQAASSISIDRIRERLKDDELMLEFFEARGLIYVCLLSRSTCEIVPLTRVWFVREHLRNLNAQFTHLQLNGDDSTPAIEPELSKTLAVLAGLHRELMEPIRDRCSGLRLIIVPDGPLRYVPFHALFDGEHFLTEDCILSYAGSASLYYLGSMKESLRQGGDVMIGCLGSPHASFGSIPHFLKMSNIEELKAAGSHRRFIHLDCQLGLQEDNPILSTIQVGGVQRTVLDLFSLDLSCSLIALTGTGSGIRARGDGRELQGLARALEYTGARTLLLPLWNSTEEHAQSFLNAFYGVASSNADKAAAFQMALGKMRKQYPHPFQWASYTLRGQTGRDTLGGEAELCAEN